MIRVGESAWLLELDGSTAVLAAHQALLARRDDAIAELVPGAASLLVLARPDVALDPEVLRAAEEQARRAASDAGAPLAAARTHTVSLRYDGPDLDELARRAGLGAADFAAGHAAATYRVAFVGFQPGFAYLEGLPHALHAPRRATPRARVPAGSVAIGGAWTGIYPAAAPGGWNLIGTTEAILFDVTADPPALLQPGDVVRFVPA